MGALAALPGAPPPALGGFVFPDLSSMVVNRQLLPLAVTSGVTIAESPPWV